MYCFYCILHYLVRSLCNVSFFFPKGSVVDVNALGITWFVSQVNQNEIIVKRITVASHSALTKKCVFLNFSRCFGFRADILVLHEKGNYEKTFLHSNIFAVSIFQYFVNNNFTESLAWPYNHSYFRFMALLDVSTIFITLNSYLDGLFLYHKFRNVNVLVIIENRKSFTYSSMLLTEENELQRHANDSLTFVSLVLNWLWFETIICLILFYFWYDSKRYMNVNFGLVLLHLCGIWPLLLGK